MVYISIEIMLAIIPIAISMVALGISCIDIRVNRKIAEKQSKIELFQLRITIIESISKIVTFTNILKEQNIVNINFTAYNQYIKKDSSVVNAIFLICDQLFDTSLSVEDKRIDSYFELTTENAKNVYIIQYLFKELDGFENDVVTLYDIFSKFLLKIITSIEDNIVTEESIEEISGLKEKLCEVATKIDINYKEKLDKIMIIKTKN